MASRSNKRGFGSMDSERRRSIANQGGQASHGGGRVREADWDQYEDEYDDYETASYAGEEDWGDENDDRGGKRRSNSGGGRRGFGSRSREEIRSIASRSGRSRSGGSNYDEDEGGGRGGNRGGNRGGSSYGRRGFAGMNPEERRQVSRRGGETLRNEYGKEYFSEIGSRGGNSSGRSNSTERGRSSGSRGFAAMDSEKQRRIAAKGGQASHGSGRSGSSRGERGRGR